MFPMRITLCKPIRIVVVELVVEVEVHDDELVVGTGRNLVMIIVTVDE